MRQPSRLIVLLIGTSAFLVSFVGTPLNQARAEELSDPTTKKEITTMSEPSTSEDATLAQIRGFIEESKKSGAIDTSNSRWKNQFTQISFG